MARKWELDVDPEHEVPKDSHDYKEELVKLLDMISDRLSRVSSDFMKSARRGDPEPRYAGVRPQRREVNPAWFGTGARGAAR